MKLKTHVIAGQVNPIETVEKETWTDPTTGNVYTIEENGLISILSNG